MKKQQQQHVTPKEITTTDEKSSSREVSPVKTVKKKSTTKKSPVAKMVYTNRSTKEKSPDFLMPSRVCSTNEYLDSLTYSYVQAGLIDGSARELVGSRNPSCERCNPSSYYLSFDSDGENEKCKQQQQAHYSLFGES